MTDLTEQSIREELKELEKYLKITYGDNFEMSPQFILRLEKLITRYGLEREQTLLKKMDSHYNLKGGHVLLYEENGKSVYVIDRLEKINQTLKEMK